MEENIMKKRRVLEEKEKLMRERQMNSTFRREKQKNEFYNRFQNTCQEKELNESTIKLLQQEQDQLMATLEHHHAKEQEIRQSIDKTYQTAVKGTTECNSPLLKKNHELGEKKRSQDNSFKVSSSQVYSAP